jgi:hypothetical protein
LGNVLQDAVNSTAILLIVLSENYLATDSDWCAKELAMFQGALSESPHRDGRIFVVLRSDVAPPRRPAELRPFVGYTLWELDKTSGRQMPISLDFSKAGRVPLECQKLGDDIWEILRRLREARVTQTAPAPAPPAGPTVFLAEVTDELYADRSGFFTFLTQAGIRVVPAKNQQYRFTPEIGQSEIAPLLRDATLVVQMHGRTPIPSDDAYTGGIEPWLLAQAQAAGKKPGATLLRWRRQGTKADDIADAAHRDLVFGGDVIAEDLEQFKQLVVQRVRELTERRRVSVGGQGPKVLVLTKQDDSHTPVVNDLTDIIDGDGPDLARMPIQARVISDSVSLETIAKEFEEQHAQPLALVVVHADGDETWVQERMQQCRNYQLKKRPKMPLCAVVVKPPDNQMHPRSKPGRFDVIPHDNAAMQKAFLAKLAEEARP